MTILTVHHKILIPKAAAGDPIDVGSTAIDRASSQVAGFTFIDLANPANDTGSLDTIALWCTIDLAGVVVATFLQDATPTDFTPVDRVVLGAVTAGSEQEFTGLGLTINVGNFIGIYWTNGTLEIDNTGGSGVYYKAGDQTAAGKQTYTNVANRAQSVYGTGTT